MTSPTLAGTSRRTVTLTYRTSFVALVLQAAVQLALMPFVLRSLGSALLGVWAATAGLTAVAALADLGTGTEVTRRIAEGQGRGDVASMQAAAEQGRRVLLIGGTATAAVGIVSAPLLVHALFSRPPATTTAWGLVLFVQATAVVFSVGLAGQTWGIVLRGVQRTDADARATTGGVLAGAAVTVGVLAAGGGLWALLAGQAAQVATTRLWQRRAAMRICPWASALRRRGRRLGPGVLRLSLLAAFMQVADVVDTQFDRLVLARYGSLSSVSDFFLGTTLIYRVRLVPLLVLGPLLVGVSELRQLDGETAARLFRRITHGSVLVGGACFATCFALARPLVGLWLGRGHSPVVMVTRWFAVAMLVNIAVAPLGLRAVAEAQHRLSAAGAAVAMVVNGTTSVVLSMAWGLRGAVTGSVLGAVSGAGWLVVAYRRHVAPATQIPWRGLGAVMVLGAAGTIVGSVLPGGRAPAVLVVAPMFGAIVLAGSALAEGYRPSTVRELLRPASATRATRATRAER